MSKLMLRLCLLLLLVLPTAVLWAQTDVLHYTIRLNIPNVNQRYIEGRTTVLVRQGEGSDTLALDLLGLQVQSIVARGHKLDYVRSGQHRLYIAREELGLRYNDTCSYHITYSGAPQQDPYFGGFYFREGYAYNMGCSITQQPHNYGKVWFPCIDNFIDKATYTFEITVPRGLTAVCGGVLTDSSAVGTGQRRFVWQLKQPIPTYLAAVAVGPFTCINDSVQGLQGMVPISLYVAPQHLDATRKAFVNLKAAFNLFEQKFGPYAWLRIGYSLLPFDGGAMEHATNIGYPLFALGQPKQWEHLLVHELAHSWFGNQVTCRTAADMWLNEGFARWCELLFIEHQYGQAAAQKAVKELAEKYTSKGYLSDGGALALSPMPESHTYGNSTYDKGGLVVHALRGYVGDTAFFKALQDYMLDWRYDNAHTENLQMHCVYHTQKAKGSDSKAFFNSWVLQPGLPVFVLERDALAAAGSVVFEIIEMGWQRTQAGAPYRLPVVLEYADGSSETRWTSGHGTQRVSWPVSKSVRSIALDPTLSMNVGAVIRPAQLNKLNAPNGR